MDELLTVLREMFETWPAVWFGFIFAIGLIVGSFLNVVIHRLPIMLERDWKAQAREILSEEQSSGDAAAPPAYSLQPTASQKYNLIVPRSACPKCSAPIKAWQNIPVVSWLLLGGKCANCKAPISIRYPLVELLTGILSVLVAWKFGVHWYTAAALFFTWMLLAMGFIDFDTTLLPDQLTLLLLWVGLIVSLAGTDPMLGLPVDPKSSIIGAAAGYLSLWSVYHLFKLLTGKEGMAHGDFKLLGALGAWLGWQSLLLIVLLSSFVGAIVGITLIVTRRHDRNIPIPFGPYLSAAGWIALMWGDSIIRPYLELTGFGGG
jgi:leader peptidase (prepilin peptidase)/N-methyltransferase